MGITITLEQRNRIEAKARCVMHYTPAYINNVVKVSVWEKYGKSRLYISWLNTIGKEEQDWLDLTDDGDLTINFRGNQNAADAMLTWLSEPDELDVLKSMFDEDSDEDVAEDSVDAVAEDSAEDSAVTRTLAEDEEMFLIVWYQNRNQKGNVSLKMKMGKRFTTYNVLENDKHIGSFSLDWEDETDPQVTLTLTQRAWRALDSWFDWQRTCKTETNSLYRNLDAMNDRVLKY